MTTRKSKRQVNRSTKKLLEALGKKTPEELLTLYVEARTGNVKLVDEIPPYILCALDDLGSLLQSKIKRPRNFRFKGIFKPLQTPGQKSGNPPHDNE